MSYTPEAYHAYRQAHPEATHREIGKHFRPELNDTQAADWSRNYGRLNPPAVGGVREALPKDVIQWGAPGKERRGMVVASSGPNYLVNPDDGGPQISVPKGAYRLEILERPSEPAMVDPGPTGPLSPGEQDELEACERVIEHGRRTFLQVGEALLTVRERRLYRERHQTFEEYCAKRWMMGKSTAYRMIQATEAVQDVSQVGTKPANQTQALALAEVPREQRAEVWTAAVERAPEGRVTADHIRTTAADLLTPETAAAAAGAEEEPGTGRAWPKPNRNGVYPDELAEVWRENGKDPRAYCEIRLLELRKGWIWAGHFQLPSAYHGDPLCSGNERPTRNAALRDGLMRAVEWLGAEERRQFSKVDQREAHRLAEGCHAALMSIPLTEEECAQLPEVGVTGWWVEERRRDRVTRQGQVVDHWTGYVVVAPSDGGGPETVCLRPDRFTAGPVPEQLPAPLWTPPTEDPAPFVDEPAGTSLSTVASETAEPGEAGPRERPTVTCAGARGGGCEAMDQGAVAELLEKGWSRDPSGPGSLFCPTCTRQAEEDRDAWDALLERYTDATDAIYAEVENHYADGTPMPLLELVERELRQREKGAVAA